MEDVLLIGLSLQTALRRELDIVANNIANLNTTGYKTDGAVFAEYLGSSESADQYSAFQQRLSLVEDRMSWHDMRQGAVQRTGNPLDVAIDGGGMLVVQAADRERYTRNGSLQLNAAGELVTSAGDKVLGDSGPIVLQQTDRDIVITADGTITVREGQSLNSDSTRGKLRLVTFADPQQLQKVGSSYYQAPEGVVAQPLANPRVVQGAIEKSNVHSMIEMTRMIEITRTYAEVANIIQQQIELQRTAIQQLAEVSA
jgi:flagellar basal-body rod protein FlgF